MDAYEQQQLQKEFNNYLIKIQKRCVEILQEEIYTSLYYKYEPTEYERTYQLLENIVAEIRGNALYIGLDEDRSYYYSIVDNSEQTQNVMFWTNYGHKDGTEIKNKYHDYSGRHFIEKAARKIRQELGIRVAIIKDQYVVYDE